MNKEQEGIKKMETMTLSEKSIVGSVFAFSELDVFPSNRRFIHNFFKEKKEDPEFSSILEDFVFSEVDAYPFSRRLESSIAWLSLGHSITALNYEYARFGMNKDARDTEENILKSKNIPHSHIELLKKLGQEFKSSASEFAKQEKSKNESMVIHFDKRRSSGQTSGTT